MSSIGGYRGIDPGVHADDTSETHDDTAADASGDTPTPESVAPPIHGAVATDTAAALMQARFGQLNSASAPNTTGSTQVDSTLDQISDTQKQIDDLCAQRDELQREIDEPDTDAWEAVWLQYDLSDLNYQIADLSSSIGQMEDSLVDQVMSDGWDNIMDAMSTCLGAQDLQGDGALANLDMSTKWVQNDSRFETEQQRQLDGRKSNEARDKASSLGRAAESRPAPRPIPATAPAPATAHAGMKDLLQRMGAIENPTRDDYEQLKQALAALRR